MTTLNDLERRAKALADTREAVSAIVGELNAGIDALKREHMKALKRAVAAAAEQHERLRAVIEENPQLFVKPRTVVLHGIKFGYVKGAGKLEYDDERRVIALIRKHFPDQVDVLVATRETPVKAALSQLAVADLKRLGVTVEGTDDVVVIKPTDSEVDKLVNQLLKSAVDEAAEA
jgi:hypothetical protein